MTSTKTENHSQKRNRREKKRVKSRIGQLPIIAMSLSGFRSSPSSSLFLLLPLLLGGLPLRLQDSLHLLSLPLSSDVGAKALLGELETPFVLGDFEQLEAPLLVGSEPGDLPHHLADELDVLVLHTLTAGRLRRRLVLRDAKSLISDSADGHRVFWRHFKKNSNVTF